MKDCSLLILSYNNFENLETLLPSVELLIAHSKQYQLEVSIIQNGNCKKSEELIQKQYPSFNYLQADNNYLFSYNAIVQQQKSKTVFILNDDLIVSNDIINLAMPLFKVPHLFAVSCLIYDWGSRNIQWSGAAVEFNKQGIQLDLKKSPISEAVYSFYACGGAAIYRTEMFNALGGFDSIYYPAYYEDTDLSHRAWQKGWTSIVHPKAWVEHKSAESWKNAKNHHHLMSLQARNKMIGSLVNYHSTKYIFFFVLSFPYRFIYSLFYQKVFHHALRGILRLTFQIRKKRNENIKGKKFSDNWMLSKIARTFEAKVD